MERVVEVVELGNLVEDDLEVFFGDHGVRGGHRHFHGVHVLNHDREAFKVYRFRVHYAEIKKNFIQSTYYPPLIFEKENSGKSHMPCR